MQTETGERTALLRVVMEQDFDKFDDACKAAFLNDLATLTGMSTDDLQATSFRSGCVIAEVKIPEDVLERILDLYAAASNTKDAGALVEFRALLAKHKIANMNGEFEAAIQVRLEKPPIDAEPGSQEIIFLHGLVGDEDTFERLPEFLGQIFSCPARAFPYPTSWLSHSPPIFYLAQGLDSWFRNNVQSEKVAIISHSMGGLVARKFLTHQAFRTRPVDKYVRQITFVASPHNGSNWAAIARKLLPWRHQQLEDLSPSSGFVAELNDAWAFWLRKNPDTAANIKAVYGSLDAVVDVPNALGMTPDSEIILGADHKSIVKPKASTDEVVRSIRRYLRSAGFRSVEPEADEGAGSKEVRRSAHP